MASDILHIKDSYYFEIPKVLAPANYDAKANYPAHLNVWVKLDDQFQEWEFSRLYDELKSRGVQNMPEKEELHKEWHHWSHGHGKPLDAALEEQAELLEADYKTWLKTEENTGKNFDAYLAVTKHPAQDVAWFATKYHGAAWRQKQWAEAKEAAGGDAAIADFKTLGGQWDWNAAKIAAYNHQLSGKLLIPQPFGELRNFYQPESGFCVSKFMIIEIAVALIMLAAFSWVARKIASGQAPRGRMWNFLEVFLVFIRDQIVAPAIGGEHHDEHDHAEQHDAHGHALAQGAHAIHADAGEELSPHHGGHGHHKTKDEITDERLFTPVLWTIFFFVLLCNLFGITPWLGSPTASFSVTLAMALVTFACVVLGGMRKFGFLGFFKNQVPSMDLPSYMAVVLIPMIFAIEIMGLLIKHGVLAVRLLANMVAGHLVILGLMGLAFGAHAAMSFSSPDVPGWQWPLVATIAVLGATVFNVLELFVAFLQAYVFTFLSALFIGAAVHKH